MNGTDFCNRIDSLLAEQNKKRNDMYIAIPEMTSHSMYDWTRRNTIPSADVALKIAQYLNTTVEYLLTGSESNILAEENATLKETLAKINELSKI